MCNFDALDATEHKVQVEDIVRTVQVRVGIYVYRDTKMHVYGMF